MIFRLYHTTLGGHTHMRLFAGAHDGALGNCGNLVMRNEEFEQFRAMSPNFQFRPDDVVIVCASDRKKEGEPERLVTVAIRRGDDTLRKL